MKKTTTELRVSEDERQTSLKKVRTDSTEMLDKNNEENCFDPDALLFGHASNFFQTPRQDYSNHTQCLGVNMFDPELFPELDTFQTDLLEELAIDLTHGFSDQTTSVNPSSQTVGFNWDEISGAIDLELDSSLFEIDETTFKI